ncbi:hypothetical protein PBY51_023655 [Eleginops maclovinus]|uniref:Secreted protein n=1 Tax=Eleginops maclovinus TaxID=56733 RepID=A0AAN8AEJ1_ELEMC|nr:hypothetical protein PBY51_023655 [Eleginops maclovinus]
MRSLSVCFVLCACAVIGSDGGLRVGHLVISEPRSHAVGHVAGALADVPDLTDMRRADRHPGSGTAVRHRTHQLPPEQQTEPQQCTQKTCQQS